MYQKKKKKYSSICFPKNVSLFGQGTESWTASFRRSRQSHSTQAKRGRWQRNCKETWMPSNYASHGRYWISRSVRRLQTKKYIEGVVWKPLSGTISNFGLLVMYSQCCRSEMQIRFSIRNEAIDGDGDRSKRWRRTFIKDLQLDAFNSKKSEILAENRTKRKKFADQCTTWRQRY